MKTLRFYYCDEQGRIVSGVNRECDDEESAARLAQRLLAEAKDMHDSGRRERKQERLRILLILAIGVMLAGNALLERVF